MMPERSVPLGGFIDRAPDMTLTQKALEQVVSWNAENDEPITLGTFLAARVPAVVSQLGLTPPEGGVRRFDELTQEEQRKTALARIAQMDPYERLSVGGYDYGREDIIDEIQAGTPFGRERVQVALQGIAFIQQLAERGKIVGIKEGPDDLPPPPDFRV